MYHVITLWVYSSLLPLFKAVVLCQETREGLLDFVMPGARRAKQRGTVYGAGRDTPEGRSSVLASTQDRSRHHDSLTVKRNLAVL